MLLLMGSGGNEKLPSCGIPTVLYHRGIEWKVPLPKHNSPHKHHHHDGVFCPYYCMVSADLPNPTRVASSEGVGREHLLCN